MSRRQLKPAEEELRHNEISHNITTTDTYKNEQQQQQQQKQQQQQQQ